MNGITPILNSLFNNCAMYIAQVYIWIYECVHTQTHKHVLGM